jgi:hypothetical protein
LGPAGSAKSKSAATDKDPAEERAFVAEMSKQGAPAIRHSPTAPCNGRRFSFPTAAEPAFKRGFRDWGKL